MNIASRFRALVSLRTGEILIMSGFFIIGFFFAPAPLQNNFLRFNLAVAGILAYILSVYTLNSYADYRADQVNPRLAHLSKLGRKTYLLLSILGIAVFIAIFGSLNLWLIPLSLLAYLSWIFYYILRYKGRPYAGTAIHFIAGILHFHFGYCAVHSPSAESVLGAVFFALVLSAGHVNHEILDYNADFLADVQTTAVKIGIPKANRNLLLLFSVSSLYGFIFSSLFREKYPAFFLFPLAALATVITGAVTAGKLPATVFRLFYRSLFALCGILFCAERISSSFKAQ